MQTLSPETTRRLSRIARFLGGFAACAAAGYALGAFGLAEWLPRDGTGPAPTWSDFLAALSALLLIISGLYVAFVSLNPVRLGAVMKYDGLAKPAETRDARIQAAVALLGGVLLSLPILGDAVPDADPLVAYLVILLLMFVQSMLNWRLFRAGDELVRTVMLQAGALSFWILQGPLFLYAGAERLGLVAPLTAWDALSVMFFCYLVLSFWVATRRGLA